VLGAADPGEDHTRDHLEDTQDTLKEEAPHMKADIQDAPHQEEVNGANQLAKEVKVLQDLLRE